MTHKLLTFFIVFKAFQVHSHTKKQIDSLAVILNTSEDFIERTEKCEILINLSSFYLTIDNNETIGDSIGKTALIIASSIENPDVSLKYYNKYLAIKKDLQVWHLENQIIKQTESLVEKSTDLKTQCNTFILLSDYYLSTYEGDIAKVFASKAMQLAKQSNNDTLIIKSHLALGDCFNKEMEKVDAFQEFATAVIRSEKIGNNYLANLCYENLADFYVSIGVNEKAKDYLRKKLYKLGGKSKVDSNEIVRIWIKFEQLEFNPNFTLDKNSRANRIFKYADRHQNNLLRSNMLALCRSFFIDGKRIDQLKFLYQEKYPEQLEILKNKDYVNYLRLMALFYENDKKIDSAQTYFIKAEKEILNNTNLALISKFYLRYGQFFERQKDFGLAVLMYNKSMEYANKAKLPNFALEASICIENLFFENEDFEEAYKYSVQNQKLSNQINNLALKDDLMSLEIENSAKLQNLAFEKQELANQIKLEEEEDRKNILLFSGLLFFIFSIGLWSRLRFIRKSRIELSLEKDKSDNLLLNILPQRVANELKEKGSFAPRAFDQSTVLFSDFKNFTQLSATMPVSELIKELDECFKAFDKIIEKYNLEKIKTIGDAYMAASGLSKLQTVPPDNAIKAGLEMQAFIENRKAKRENQNSIAFEMRLGIHTGPVIAGIVGAKKFQYDIWGDTVNIASRMESNGIVGRVNISGETVSLVQNKADFVFTSRGKVDVKGKGEMEMYFVDDVKNEVNNSLEILKENSQKAQHYILQRLRDETPEDLKYHSVDHTLGLLNSVTSIAKNEGVSDYDIEILLLAAAYHDSGFLRNYDDHEESSCDIVDETLPSYGFTLSQIAEIKEMIQSTKIPQNPKNKLAKILCDADLYYLGVKHYYEIAGLLKEELTKQGMKFTPVKWLDFQINFLKGHKYFTEYAQKQREPSKNKILQELQAQKEKLKKK